MVLEDVKIVDPSFTVERGWIEFSDRIVSLGEGKKDGGESGEGLILMPGFVDTHVHGGVGQDFMDASPDFDKLERYFFSNGVTTVLATTLTASLNDTRRAVRRIAERMKENPLTPICGVHLEGPVISPKHIGAQNPEYAIKGTLENVRAFLDGFEDVVRVITVAIEECDDEAMEYMVSKGITVSAGHTDATFEKLKKAKKLGIGHLTHFCNAMTGLHHRHIGLVGAGLTFEDLLLELICDGIHLDEAMLSLILKLHPHDRLIAITDSMRAAGLADGKYDLGGLEVTVEKGAARLKNGSLAGSTLKYNEGLKRLKNLGLNLNEIAGVSSLTPLDVAKPRTPKGRILPGYDADLVLVDDDFKIRKTFKRGVEVHVV